MIYARKVRGCECFDGTYYAALVELEIDEFFAFWLCIRRVDSDTIRVIHLQNAKQEKKEIADRYFPWRKGLGEIFPEIKSPEWMLSRYRLTEVISGRVGVWKPVSKDSTQVRRRLGKVFGRNLWGRLEQIRKGERLVANMSR